MCESFSLSHICHTCQTTFLTPSIYRQKIHNNIEVISFYKYNDIKELLHTKHTDLGYYIYKILAKNSIEKFASEFNFNFPVTSIAIDDHAESGYSHTAVLNKALKSTCIKPQHNKLRAQNRVSYSGKSKEFRLFNSRNFHLKEFKGDNIILIDDLITTGSTLEQAIHCINKNNKRVLFCITLSYTSLK